MKSDMPAANKPARAKDRNAERIWLKSYADDVPTEVPAPQFRSLRELMEFSFDEYADGPAFTNLGKTLDYRDVDRLSMRFACFLQQTLGLTRGERVAVMMPNLLQYPVVLAGIFRAGLVAVNVNPLYTRRELRHQLKDSGAKCIVILENFAETLEKVIGEVDVRHVVTTQVGDLLGWPKSLVTNFVVKRVKKAVPAFSLPGRVKFPAALRSGAKHELQHVELGFADIAFLQYTGGTTGVAKGAMLSHRNMVYNVMQSHSWLGDIYEGVERIVAITPLPLYHIFSLQSNLLSVMYDGGENVLITNPRDLPAFVKELRRHKFTYITGVNTMFAALLNAPGFADIDFSHLRLAVGGGMAVQEAVAKRWKEVTGLHIVQGYGLTETSPVATTNPMNLTEFNGSIGLPIPSTDVRIVDDDGKPLPVGERGEICIRGPQVMEGYWRQPEETAKVMLPGGWLRTGDIGHMDENGYVYVEDRKKDMILVSAFNVYPNEIEGVVVELDGVLEAAAVGIPDEKSGEAVKLFVVRRDESVTEEDILNHCRENLTAYKVPKEIEFRDELPKTNVGKILRRALREDQEKNRG